MSHGNEQGQGGHHKPDKGWKLNVQGVIITSEAAEISVRDALIEAGFDPDEGWTAILRTKGDPKKPVDMDYVIDLREPGIEKLRLRPDNINNGEAPQSFAREFHLLEKDEAYLNARGFRWETTIEGKRRWLIIRDFPLPPGFNHEKTDLAIDVPNTYPTGAIDMFFCFPALKLANGRVPPNTQSTVTCEEKSFQQWSRHRHGNTRWNPEKDSIITQIALAEDALAKEVAE